MVGKYLKDKIFSSSKLYIEWYTKILKYFFCFIYPFFTVAICLPNSYFAVGTTTGLWMNLKTQKHSWLESAAVGKIFLREWYCCLFPKQLWLIPMCLLKGGDKWTSCWHAWNFWNFWNFWNELFLFYYWGLALRLMTKELLSFVKSLWAAWWFPSTLLESSLGGKCGVFAGRPRSAIQL